MAVFTKTLTLVLGYMIAAMFSSYAEARTVQNPDRDFNGYPVRKVVKGTAVITTASVIIFRDDESRRSFLVSTPYQEVQQFETRTGETLRGKQVTLTLQCKFNAYSPLSGCVIDTAAFRDAKDIELLYNQVLGRGSDPEGLKGWVGYYLSSGVDISVIRRAFADSPESQNHIREQYKEVLRRLPNSTELKYSQDFLADTGTLEQLRSALKLQAPAYGFAYQPVATPKPRTYEPLQ
jgi:Domain of unknown function (DUF4214)